MNSEIEDSFTDEKQSDEDKTVKPKETVEDKPKKIERSVRTKRAKQVLSNVKAEDIVEDKSKRAKKGALSNVKAKDIVETQPAKNVVTGNYFAKLTKKALKASSRVKNHHFSKFSIFR